MNYRLLLGLCLLPFGGVAQHTINARLKHELDSLFALDQLYRLALFDPSHSYTHLLDSLARAHRVPVGHEIESLSALMVKTDSSDMKRVQAIIQQYGYPGKTLVGTPTNETAFFIIQHSTRIGQYLPLIKQAAEHGELPFRLYAMMVDRHLMETQKAQVYGTQGYGFGTVNKVTGKLEPHTFIWPTQDPKHVNERRQRAGFDLTVEQNAQRLGIPYQVLTIEQVSRMPGYRRPKR